MSNPTTWQNAEKIADSTFDHRHLKSQTLSSSYHVLNSNSIVLGSLKHYCIDSDRESFYYYRLKAEVVIFTFASMPKVPKTTNPAKIEVREFPKAISQASLEVNCHSYCYIKLRHLWQLLVNELYEERSS